MARTKPTSEQLFWDLIDELRATDDRVEEGTIMNGRCARVAGEFLALVDFKGSGLVVKLPRARVDELVAGGLGRPFAPRDGCSMNGSRSPNPTRGNGSPCSAKASRSSGRRPSAVRAVSAEVLDRRPAVQASTEVTPWRRRRG